MLRQAAPTLGLLFPTGRGVRGKSARHAPSPGPAGSYAKPSGAAGKLAGRDSLAAKGVAAARKDARNRAETGEKQRENKGGLTRHPSPSAPSHRAS
jgi:hypothetical protein